MWCGLYISAGKVFFKQWIVMTSPLPLLGFPSELSQCLPSAGVVFFSWPLWCVVVSTQVLSYFITNACVMILITVVTGDTHGSNQKQTFRAINSLKINLKEYTWLTRYTTKVGGFKQAWHHVPSCLTYLEEIIRKKKAYTSLGYCLLFVRLQCIANIINWPSLFNTFRGDFKMFCIDLIMVISIMQEII